MKMWKSKRWQLEITGIDGNTKLFGVNIFDYQWIDTKQRVQVSDFSYEVPVYTVMIGNVQYDLLLVKAAIVFGTSMYISSDSRTFSLFFPPFTHRYTALSFSAWTTDSNPFKCGAD